MSSKLRWTALLGVAALAAVSAEARRFYDDDPLAQDPKPLAVEKIKSRKVNDYYDFFSHTFALPGELNRDGKAVPAQGVNTLGEVPDGPWYVNRHYARRMTLEELRRGPDAPNPPASTGTWRIVGAKTQGITPGFTIVDSRGVRYLLKFDPPKNPEMASAADRIGSHFFYALGYHVPENYVVYFPPERLALDPKTTFIDSFGKKRPMTQKDVFEVMRNVPRDKNGNYRGAASLFLKGQPVGERRFYGTRTDDPNDIVPHEHRRDLRGLYVFSSWLGHDDSRAINSLDMLVQDGGAPHVRHYLIDFGSLLGSASSGANSARSGHDYLFSWRSAAKQFLTLGLVPPYWAFADFPEMPSIGRLESKVYRPDEYRPEYPNPAYFNRLPEDEFWAAKQVVHFTDEEIRAIVEQGQYTDPKATEYLTRTLIERRDKVGKVYLERVLPLDRFRLVDNRLEFEDLGVKHGTAANRGYRVVWSRFDNASQQSTAIAEGTDMAIPAAALGAGNGAYLAAVVTAAGNPHRVTVYVRREPGGFRVVGVDRTGK